MQQDKSRSILIITQESSHQASKMTSYSALSGYELEHSKQSNPQPHHKKLLFSSGENPPPLFYIHHKQSLPQFSMMYYIIDIDQMPDNFFREIFIGHEKESKDISGEYGLCHT